MKAFHQKHPLTVALVLIALYVGLGSVLVSLPAHADIGPLYPLLFHLVLAVFLLGFLRRSGLWSDFGLVRPTRPARDFLFYIPLALAPLVNFLYPITSLSPLPALLAFLNMLLVGLVEELVFRGFLFRAMYADSPRAAVIVSSLTFGIGHIVNLLNGAPPVATLLQILYATVFGFLFVVLLLESKSLFPAILTHSAVNATSVFTSAEGGAENMNVIGALALTVIGLFYLLFLLKKRNNKSEHKGDMI